jgi:DNA-directed RNA polymerase sigma subunit (sigma70/sigma32)
MSRDITDEKATLTMRRLEAIKAIPDLKRDYDVARRAHNWAKVELREALWTASEYLDEEHKKVVRERFKGKTLDEVGKDMGYTKERIRQMESRAYELFRWMKEDN